MPARLIPVMPEGPPSPIHLSGCSFTMGAQNAEASLPGSAQQIPTPLKHPRTTNSTTLAIRILLLSGVQDLISAI
jgi:hypothetical protein